MIPCYCMNCGNKLFQIDKVEHYSEEGDIDLSFRGYVCNNCKMSYELQPTYNELGEKNCIVIIESFYSKNGGLN